MWRFPPHRVVIAVDFGEASAAAARMAGAIASAFHARVTALHAESMEAPPYFTSEQTEAFEEQRRAARSDAGRYLARFAEHLAGVPVEASISESPPADAILLAARDADLVTMGTHGRRGPARWWAGSVAERVVRHSSAPVLVVSEASDFPAATLARVRIVAAPGTFDGSARRYARGLAAAFNGTVEPDTLLAIPPSSPEPALLVIARPSRRSRAWISDTAGDALRRHRGAMLFVPAV